MCWYVIRLSYLGKSDRDKGIGSPGVTSCCELPDWVLGPKHRSFTIAGSISNQWATLYSFLFCFVLKQNKQTRKKTQT